MSNEENALETIDLCDSDLNPKTIEKYEALNKNCKSNENMVLDTIIDTNSEYIKFFNDFDVLKPVGRSKRRQRRSIIGAHWPIADDGFVYVPYENILNVDSTNNAIEAAIEEFNRNTCIRFIRRRNDEKDYVKIISDIRGCWSNSVGRKGGVQEVSLRGGQCDRKGVVIHEFMHVLGFAHEHQRRDRDEYIDIRLENIKESLQTMMMKNKELDGQVVGEKYDYSSVMHYGSKAGTKDPSSPKKTIVPLKDPSAQLGQRETFSTIDLIQINKMYYCTDFVSTVRPIVDKKKEQNLHKLFFQSTKSPNKDPPS